MATCAQKYESWHSSHETAESLRQFAEFHARQPDTSNLRSIQHKLITKLEAILKTDKKCSKLEFTGSAYEGVQIGPEVEFDVMVVIDGSGIHAKQSEISGYYHLSAKSSFFWGIDSKYEEFLSGDDKDLVPDKVISRFFSSLQKAVSRLLAQGFDYCVKLRSHGPAIQMDVYRDYGILLFSVDVVPAFKCGDMMFVAKSLKDEQLNSDRLYLWRYSTSLQEKQFLDRIDSGNHCRKKVLRIAKAMIHRDQLQGFRSYHLKTALMHLCTRLTQNSSWRETELPLRFMDLLSLLENTLHEKNMPHMFIGRMNLYDGIPEATLMNMYHRVRRIRKCEHIFSNVFGKYRREGFRGNMLGLDEPQSLKLEYHNGVECKKCQEAINGDPSWCQIM